ncbi:MAG: hypothetical protein EOO11_16635, partial [Chitinophagaceae bacterium]
MAQHEKAIPDFLSGGGELGERIRDFDWAGTPLGPVAQWPQSLRTCVRIMLASRQPIWIGWGPELIKLYNDPYKAIVGGKHPWALGKPASVVWREIWDDIAPMLDTVMGKDQGTYVEAQLLIMERNGYPEETYYTFSYTPVPGEDGRPAGMICFNTDDTERIISERQLRTLTRLGKLLTDPSTNDGVVTKLLEAICENPHDFPFAAFYSWEKGLAHCAGATVEDQAFLDRQIDPKAGGGIAAAFARASSSRSLQLADVAQWGDRKLPTGAWQVPPRQVGILPISTSGKEPYGFLLFGLNPYRLVDEPYAGFFS